MNQELEIAINRFQLLESRPTLLDDVTKTPMVSPSPFIGVTAKDLIFSQTAKFVEMGLSI
jgi:hypothetical protein